MTASPRQKTACADINAVSERLEGLRGEGYFAQSRNLAAVWYHLKDKGFPVDMLMLGGALSRMSETGSLLRTPFSDGFLRYVDMTKAEHWQNAAGPLPCRPA